ncbi:hypothetical protein QZH41_019471 [Actinostola sp. cb2023]|nr:hypothetical protein QZH41_019471 [Actinostola sp. cb2023]
MVPSTAAFPSSYGTTVIPGAGTPNVEGQEGNNSTDTMSKSTFIIVLVTGIGGFVVLAIIIIYILVKFLRRMKGEFVPDKVYPNEQKSNSGSDQLIPSFIDPSTPRITDVPKKTVRAPVSNGTASGSGQPGGGAGAGKKAKKPMGVKVTYKPPKWD